MALEIFYTAAGYKTHYTTDRTRSLCGRPVTQVAGETLDMCKACEKSAAKITAAAPAPVEPTPAETPATCAHRYATVTGSVAQCGATPAAGQTLCTYHGGEAAPVETAEDATPVTLSRPMRTTGGSVPVGAERVYSYRADWIMGMAHGSFDLYRFDEDAAYGELGDGIKWYGIASFSGAAPALYYSGGSMADALGALAKEHQEHARRVDQASISLAGVRVATITHGDVVINFLPETDATPAPFDFTALTPAERTTLETNLGRVDETITSARGAVAADGTHAATYFRPGTLTLRADVDPAAYSSAVANANDTARENGFPRLSQAWFDCFGSTYSMCRDENDARRENEAFEAAQEEEARAEYARVRAHTHAILYMGANQTACGWLVQGDPATGTLRVSVDPTDATCEDCTVASAAVEAEDAQYGPTDDEIHAEIIANAPRDMDAALHAAVRAAEDAERGILTLRLTPMDDGRVMATVGAYERPFQDNRAVRMQAAFWAHTKGFQPVKGRGFAWGRSGKLVEAPARLI